MLPSTLESATIFVAGARRVDCSDKGGAFDDCGFERADESLVFVEEEETFSLFWVSPAGGGAWGNLKSVGSGRGRRA